MCAIELESEQAESWLEALTLAFGQATLARGPISGVWSQLSGEARRHRSDRCGSSVCSLDLLEDRLSISSFESTTRRFGLAASYAEAQQVAHQFIKTFARSGSTREGHMLSVRSTRVLGTTSVVQAESSARGPGDCPASRDGDDQQLVCRSSAACLCNWVAARGVGPLIPISVLRSRLHKRKRWGNALWHSHRPGMSSEHAI